MRKLTSALNDITSDNDAPTITPEQLPVGYVIRKEPKSNRRSFALQKSVLDALQEAHEDNFEAFMGQSVREASAELLAAMLNDYAEDMGWPERWTARDIKKRFSYGYLVQKDIFGMLTRALIPESAAANNTEPGNDSGN